jgi:hypothetical protein
MDGILYFNGQDANAVYGFAATALPDAWSAPSQGWDTLAVPGYDGVRLVRETASVGARALVIPGLIRGTDAADAETKVQALKDALWGGTVEIRFAYQGGTRAYYGVLTEVAGNLFAPGNLSGWVSVQVAFLLADPYALDLSERVDTGLAGALVPVHLGTGPTWPLVTIRGAATNPTLTWRDFRGDVIGTMAFTATLAGAANALIIETTDGGDVWTWDGTTLGSGFSLLTAGYSIPVFSPRDGVRGSSQWPTVSVSSGTLTVTYARRWV